MIEDFITRANPVKYCSQTGDLVIGRVIDRQGEHYRVDLHDRFDALLQYYDFEGASKRNRPSLESGDLIYARVQRASVNSGALLTCKSANNKKSWSSGEAEFGPLNEGYCLNCPIKLCQFLLGQTGNEFLETIGRKYKFEAVIGFNGKIWIKTAECFNTILVANVIQKAMSPQKELTSLLAKLNII